MERNGQQQSELMIDEKTKHANGKPKEHILNQSIDANCDVSFDRIRFPIHLIGQFGWVWIKLN